ncbi:MAG: hypothetical protein U0T81_08855 [Saprospiraceae bacterium]
MKYDLKGLDDSILFALYLYMEYNLSMREYSQNFSGVQNNLKTEKLNFLQNSWDQAYERLYSALSKDRIDLILKITALNDIDYLRNYLITQGNKLKPEEKYFIEMSIRLKEYPESKNGSKVEDENYLNNSISDEDFQKFVSNNHISIENLKNHCK